MRDHRLDMIRSLALLMIIMVHTWSLSGIQEESEVLSRIYHVVIICGVPMFVMLSGALVLGAQEMPLHIFYKKRYSRLLIPFLIWSGVVYVLSCVAGKYADVHSVGSAILQYVPHLVTNTVNEAYWYVQMIAALYLITPFLQRSLKGASMKELGIVIGTGFVLLAVSDLCPDVYWNRYISRLLYFLLYYLFGYWAYRTIEAGNKKAAILCGMLLVAGIVATVWNRTALSTWVEAASLFTLLLCCPKKRIRGTEVISSASYATYLTHFVVVSPTYQLMHWNAAVAPFWQMAVLPFAMAAGILAVFTLGFYGVKRVTPWCQYLGIA